MSTRFPLGIQTFSEIRRNGYVYVDKTAQVYRLATGGKYHFLSRPRRFGKSLLISTLDDYFSGRKELFEGLAIAGMERDWIQYPVFHLDLTGANYNEDGALENKLHVALKNWERIYGKDADESALGVRFSGVIRRAYEQTGRQAVLLVDEYEKPVLDTIDNPAMQEKNRSQLNGFYGVIKGSDPYLKFVLLTGVTKIGKLSVFSALNNITDISMSSNYADICGITEDELENVFHGDIQSMADENEKSYDEMKALLKREYDGYRFSRQLRPAVYNPYSLLNALAHREIRHYWYETGTPTFLIQLIKKYRPNLGQLENVTIDADALSMVNTFSSNPLPILYQSGYLTIADYDAEFSTYTLNYPNHEVKEGFLKGLLPLVLGEERTTEFSISHFVRAVRRGDTDDFFERINALLADIPYENKPDYEMQFQNFLYLLFRLMGFYTDIEYHTARGRADLILKTDQYIFVMELKRDASAEAAMQQIKDKNYAAPFKSDDRKIILVGANFASDMSGVEGVLTEEM